jgi:peptide/nickel transport system ATP-binding protein
VSARDSSILLDVRDLSVRFRTRDGIVRAVSELSFTLRRGETLGVVGESGSGKSVTSLAIMGLLNRATADIEGEVLFEGTDLLRLGKNELRKVRGRDVSMIFQDPFACLHPMYRVGAQISEAVRAHSDVSRSAAWNRAVELLGAVGIPNAKVRARDYPHQFSGGMRQRAMIAMAMSLNPKLLIADEPTTALDVTVQAQVLAVIKTLQQEFGTAVLLITHDLGVIADVADDVQVMYAGAVMEKADLRTTFFAHHHPYTEGLLLSLPAYGGERNRLHSIHGQPPSLISLPPGCPFSPRCAYVMDRCRTEVPQLAAVGTDATHLSACWLPHDTAARNEARRKVIGEPLPAQA